MMFYRCGGKVTQLMNRQLTENILKWAFYPQLGILNYQLGISYPPGDWVFIFWPSYPVLDIPKPYWGCIIPNLG